MTADVGLHVYGNRKIRSQFKMKEADRKLTAPHDEAEKHLGVLFDRMLSYRQHIGSIVKKVNRMIGLILLSCPSHNFPPLAGACHCQLCHCGQVVSRAGLV